MSTAGRLRAPIGSGATATVARLPLTVTESMRVPTIRVVKGMKANSLATTTSQVLCWAATILRTKVAESRLQIATASKVRHPAS
jgi:hypothetical protein